MIFAKELRNICRFLGASEGIMQRGHMRFEPNVNVIIETDDGREYATPIVEVKNLNSFRAVHDAIEYEHQRQVEAWKSDGIIHGPGLKSTRGWNDSKRVTLLQREKEEAHDYRYLPDPDLIPVVISDEWRREIESEIPELPIPRRARYRREYDLAEKDAAALTDERDLCLFYEQCVEAIHAERGSEIPGVHGGQACAKLLLNAGAKRAHERSRHIHELGITPEQIVQLILLRDSNAIGSSAANELFALLCETDDDAAHVAERAGLMQVSDEGQLDTWIEQAIQAQPQAADDFSKGKDAALGRLVGEVMKISRGQAEAKSVRAKLRERLRGG